MGRDYFFYPDVGNAKRFYFVGIVFFNERPHTEGLYEFGSPCLELQPQCENIFWVRKVLSSLLVTKYLMQNTRTFQWSLTATYLHMLSLNVLSCRFSIRFFKGREVRSGLQRIRSPGWRQLTAEPVGHLQFSSSCSSSAIFAFLTTGNQFSGCIQSVPKSTNF